MGDIILTFLVSVIAGVVSANGWTEIIGSNSLNGLALRNEQENPQSGNSGGFRFSPDGSILTFLSYTHYMRFF